MSSFNLQQLSTIHQISKPALVRAQRCDVANDTIIEDVHRAPVKRPLSLWDIGVVSQSPPPAPLPAGQEEPPAGQRNPDRHMLLVFIGVPHASLSTLIDNSDWREDKKVQFYLTDSFARMHPRKYFCKVRLLEQQARNTPLQQATSSFVNDNIEEKFWEGDHAEYYSPRWDPDKPETAELRVVFPSYMMAFLSAAFEMVTCPIVPKAVYALLGDHGNVSTVKLLEVALDERIGAQKIFIHSAAEGDNHKVKIDRGVRLYATSGNASMPFGTMTNVNSPNFNVNTIADSTQKLAIENHMRLYPSWNSLALSTYAPVRANAMNGTSTCSYVVNKKYEVNEGETVKRAFHIFAFPQHPINNHFRMLLHELIAKLPTEEASLIIWSQPPVTGQLTRITQRDMVDIITVHPSGSNYIAAKHKDMFICKKAAGQTHANVEFVEGMFAVYSADFDRFKLAVADLADLPFGHDIEKK